jgi:beta-glucosidase
VHLSAGTSSIEVDYVAPSSGTATLILGWVTPAQRAAMLHAAVNAARHAQVAVVFASLFETEGADLPNINLPASENNLISAVAAANHNTVVVLNSGSAVTMPWLSQVRGVIEAWYPGQDDGNEIAAVLFGDVNPSGKLPVTFPESLVQVPDNTPAQWPGRNGEVHYSEGLLVGYRWYATKHIQPMFPFGYGLSYTTFAFRNERVWRSHSGATAISVNVTNTGSKTGTDVVQVYVRDPVSTGEPARQLRGFARVTLRPRRTARVWITLDSHSFSWWNPGTRSWTVTPGRYAVLVGDSSNNLALTQQVSISG